MSADAAREMVGELKRVLERAADPAQLDRHPWALELANGANPPGQLLVCALRDLFREMMPSVPPRRGKRLDTQWGQFGLLAALYFAPLEFGAVRPASLRDAWGRIDQVIPLYVFGRPDHEVAPAELARYRLIGDEVETAPTSTTSDWHVKGLERLAQLFLARLQHLRTQAAAAPPARPARRSLRSAARRLWPAGALLLLALGLWGAHLAWLATRVARSLGELESLTMAELDPQQLAAAGPELAALRRDAQALRARARPFLWFAPVLGWLPVYGPDLAAARPLLDLTAEVAAAADAAYAAGLPLWEATQAPGGRPAVPELAALLVAAEPEFASAQRALEAAGVARAAVGDAARLSPRTQARLTRLDRWLPLFQDGVAAAVAAPRLLGAAGAGPQTYLVLLQNEDELRATGGFITAIGVVTVEQGEITSYAVEDSYALDDPTRPTFAPPWQLQAYMNGGLWWLRDANWSADFPTTAAWAERMYTYARLHAVDGVVALDQEAVRLLVDAVGPLPVEGASEPITGANLIAYMRAAKDPSQCGGLDPALRAECKSFLGPLAQALVARLDADFDWRALLSAGQRLLAERHVLLQFDDPAAAALLAARGWDGALRPPAPAGRGGAGDFLMVVDSNLGFNKVNALVRAELTYAVDLSQPAAPQASLVVTHYNDASPVPACVHAVPDYGAEQTYADLTNGCYWNYLRVYTLAQAELLQAEPHAVPGAQLLLGEPVPAR
ncbi:MAG: DUF4012 domain-containing protein, partial [Anaerolineales bacterium]